MDAFLGSWKGTELVWHGDFRLSVTIEVDFGDSAIAGYGIEVDFAERIRREAVVEEETIRKKGRKPFRSDDLGALDPMVGSTRVQQSARPGWKSPRKDVLRAVRSLLDGVRYYRWDPRLLALPVAPDLERSSRMEQNGFGLALCLDEILGYSRERFAELERRFTGIFPQITSIRLSPEMGYRAPVDNPVRVTMLEQSAGKGLYFDLRTGGQPVPASQISDGMLLVLAYLAILYLPEPPRILLVEEPENGIHPKLLRDVLGILRDLVREQSHTQVVLTTHSPYALDLFSPEEVTLCTMQDNGEVKTTRLSESPAVRKQVDVFTLGEIWTSEGDEAIAQAQETTEESGT